MPLRAYQEKLIMWDQNYGTHSPKKLKIVNHMKVSKGNFMISLTNDIKMESNDAELI